MLFLEKTVQNRMQIHSEAFAPNATFGFLFGKIEEKNRHGMFAIPVRSYQDSNPILIQHSDYLRAKRFANEHQVDLLGVYYAHSKQLNFELVNEMNIESLSIVHISNDLDDSIKISSMRLDTLSQKFKKEEVFILEPFYS